MTVGPLSDLVVIDLSRIRAGPTCVRMLADWGAEVVKVEAPEDDTGFGARDNSDFQNLHRNKRSLTLNLKTEEGIAVLHALVRRADVIVENFRPDVKTRLGIDWEALREVNPRLIYASISGFGQDGPYARRPGFDQVAQGMGGLMSVTGFPEQGPVRAGIPIADLGSGLYACIGVLIALHERERSGEGQWVHSSLLQAQVSLLDFQAARWLMDAEVPGQAGNDHPTATPMGAYPTADGHMNLAVGGQRMWRIFCETVEREDLIDDPRFATPTERTRHRAELNPIVAQCLAQRATADWVETFNAAGIPCGPINAIDEVFADPQVRHLGLAQEVEHPRHGAQTVLGQPILMSRSQSAMRRPTPDAGEHTDEILAELGYDAEAVAGLRARGVV